MAFFGVSIDVLMLSPSVQIHSECITQFCHYLITAFYYTIEPKPMLQAFCRSLNFIDTPEILSEYS